MRKQTKIAALISAAAVLSVGGAMTAFAATGWQQENGTWVYYNRNEEKVTETWQKSGDYWFYLDDNGEMATDSLIDDDGDTYYVDVNGVMVTNRWVAVDNENAGEENEPNQWWYYFGANGKAYKRSDSSTGDVSLKTINGKKYTFNTDGKMQYGWVKDGETQHDDNAWQDSEYFFGDENDGSMAEGWKEIAIKDDQAADLQPGDNYWDEDQTRWFYFKASGKKEKSQTGKTINGRKYGFDEYGRMNAGWITTATASNTKAADGGSQGIATYSNSFLYYSTPEDGARSTKGWFKVTPGYYLQRDKYEDGSDYWYYSDGNGKLTVNEIKTVNGKKYAFDNYGRMISGFVVLQMEGNTVGSGYSSKKIVQKVDSDGTYDTGDNYNRFVKANDSLFRSGELKSYFFGGSDDGSMKTGKQTVELDSEKYTFEFAKNGSNKGVGLNGMEDHKFYVGGKLTTADADSKIEIVILDSSNKLVAKSSVEDALAAYGNGGVQHFKSNGDLDYTEYKFTGLPTGHKAYVVNTTGAMVKSGTKKDGDDYKVKTSNYTVDWVRLEE
ncbi:cell wall-binding repeat protein [Lachnoanaerobaculum sp. ICM7]|uniref:cell wall-binding protein n=1 Tax=Lachnoanaerobaculum sp. ICM7 TaxID=936594 RepID=UPI00027A6C61|nr:cell wall-binding protein [Lachnoanaerobaculum sp. ICM7]EJP18351.1 cell wall-binding repeat protein [Lachnoanaerobaculum sp. ICM7]